MSDAFSGGTRAMWMRGGTSKGFYFLKEDIPADPTARDAFFLAVMGSPDTRQIDGVGGADPLTSKVAVVSKSTRDDADVDYHFFQVYVDQALVSDAQNCGNIIAGVGPFAIERGLVEAASTETPVRIFTINSGQTTTALIQTPNGRVTYTGTTHIDGVPNPSAPVLLQFGETAGSMCGALLPSGNVMDQVEGVDVTLIDDGMPCVLMRASDLGIKGYEAPEALEADQALRDRLERIRLACGHLMNLGDVTDKSVPKMTLVSAPQDGGLINTRSFIPHRCHKTIGVMAAVSVASACRMAGSVCDSLAKASSEAGQQKVEVEHPSGSLPLIEARDADGTVQWVATARTARKLMDGYVFPQVPAGD